MKRTLPILLLICAGSAIAIFSLIDHRQFDRLEKKQNANPSLSIRADLSTKFSPLVRVNLTPSPVGKLQLSVDGPYVIRPVGSEKALSRGERLGSVSVTTTAVGFRLGAEDFPVARLEIVPKTSPAVWVNDHKYRGSIRLFRRPQGKILAVNAILLEDYIASVIDSEMPRAFPDAARRAQAIVSRTYALYQMRIVSRDSLFDVYATTRSQNYLGVEYLDSNRRRLAGESQSSRQIALHTSGSVCTHNGQLFCTYYSAACGGKTTAGSDVFTDAATPLKSVKCDWCRDAKYYRWSTRLSRSKVTTNLWRYFDELGKPFGSLASIKKVSSHSPLVPVFEVSDGRHRHSVSSVVLRNRFPAPTIYSPRFNVKTTPDEVIFEGRGHGHGVGMCQWGARGLAQAGKNALEIIDYYYPGSQVVVVGTASR